MILLPHLFGPKLKKNNWLIFSLIVCLFLYLLNFLSPFSLGDSYQKKLLRYYRLLDNSQFQKADKLESKLDLIDIKYSASLVHPRFVIATIQDILKKPNRSTDDIIEVALLYFKIGDIQNSKNFLLLAQQSDPVRSDIENLIQTLF